MLITAFLFNLLIIFTTCRRRYRSGGRGAGVGRVTETFGKGVASLIKDIKEGNWGQEQAGPQYNEKTGKRVADESQYYESIGNDTQFYVIVVFMTILIVIGILYYLIKVSSHRNEKDTVGDMRRRNAQRFKHYEAIKCVAENGIHPDKAFGRLQKIKYK